MRYLSDYHVHSDFSFDGKAPAEDIVLSAIAKGIDEICFTEHCECSYYPLDQNCEYDVFATEYLLLRDKYGDKIKIKIGIEIGQAMQNPAYAAKILDNEFDFILASYHNLADMPDFAFIDYDTADIPALLHRYFDETYEMVCQGGFDCVGHLTYPLRYMAIAGYKPDLTPFMDKIEKIFLHIIKSGCGIEINTSGLRNASGMFMPEANLIKFYRSLGGEIITTGSDSHTSEDIGAGILDAQAVIKSAGLNSFCVYEKRVPKFIEIGDE